MGRPWVFYLIVSKGPMNWDFSIGLGHFGASGSFGEFCWSIIIFHVGGFLSPAIEMRDFF